MQRSNRDIQLLADDLRGFLRFCEDASDSDDNAAAAPAQMPQQNRIGQSNAALRDLKAARDHLSSRQSAVVESIDTFYRNAVSPPDNFALFFTDAERPTARFDEQEIVTMERRASFCLNDDALHALPAVIREIPDEAGIIGHSNATLAVNAIAASVKSHTEVVNGAALQEAQRGQRICPLTLQPAKFRQFLSQNSESLNRIAVICRMSLPQPQRERLLQPRLEALAASYFQSSTRYPGAPEIRPHEVEIQMRSTSQSDIGTGPIGRIRVRLAIDSDGLDEFCSRPVPRLDDCEDFLAVFRSRMLQGFQQHSPEQRRAALYLQLLFNEVAEIQEIMGVESADNPTHSPAAQRAADRTLEEWNYTGNTRFGDQVSGALDRRGQRTILTAPMENLHALDAQFQAEYHSPLLRDARVRNWVHSPDLVLDLRALREPSGRLLLQAAPLTAQALLQTPAFSLEAGTR